MDESDVSASPAGYIPCFSLALDHLVLTQMLLLLLLICRPILRVLNLYNVKIQQQPLCKCDHTCCFPFSLKMKFEKLVMNIIKNVYRNYRSNMHENNEERTKNPPYF